MKGDKMVHLLNPERFDEVFEIMKSSFPEDEYRTYDEQKALLSDERYKIYVMTDEKTNKIKAFIAAWDFGDFCFLEHFAVSPAFRNAGLGSHMFCETIEKIAKPVVFDVEAPDSEITKRRVGFYNRLGFVLNSYEYSQPSLSPGRKPVPLRMMTKNRRVSREEFELLKNTAYSQMYGKYMGKGEK